MFLFVSLCMFCSFISHGLSFLLLILMRFLYSEFIVLYATNAFLNMFLNVHICFFLCDFSVFSVLKFFHLAEVCSKYSILFSLISFMI